MDGLFRDPLLSSFTRVKWPVFVPTTAVSQPGAPVAVGLGHECRSRALNLPSGVLGLLAPLPGCLLLLCTCCFLTYRAQRGPGWAGPWSRGRADSLASLPCSWTCGSGMSHGAPRPGIRSKLQVRPSPQLWQCQILNHCAGPGIEPLSRCSRDAADPVEPQQELLAPGLPTSPLCAFNSLSRSTCDLYPELPSLSRPSSSICLNPPPLFWR